MLGWSFDLITFSFPRHLGLFASTVPSSSLEYTDWNTEGPFFRWPLICSVHSLSSWEESESSDIEDSDEISIISYKVVFFKSFLYFPVPRLARCTSVRWLCILLTTDWHPATGHENVFVFFRGFKDFDLLFRKPNVLTTFWATSTDQSCDSLMWRGKWVTTDLHVGNGHLCLLLLYFFFLLLVSLVTFFASSAGTLPSTVSPPASSLADSCLALLESLSSLSSMLL